MLKRILLKLLPAKLYVKLQFKRRMGKHLNLTSPTTFNEKLQYIKLYDKNPLYTKLADKVAIKPYVANIIGQEYIIPTYGVWNSYDDIDFTTLPNQFVLKCNHDSGTVKIVRNKNLINHSEFKAFFQEALNRNFYYPGREWAYKNITPKIFAEELLQDINLNNEDLLDYKFFCFNGKVDSIMVCKERNTGDTKFYFFNRNWQFLKYNKENLNLSDDFSMPKPDNLKEMIAIAEKLTQGLRFIRLDLYNVNGKIYFSEYTLYPDCGYDSTFTDEADHYYGNKLDISDL